MTNTPRLALQKPIGADTVSNLRTAITNHATVLDAAVTVTTGTISAIPAASLAGRRYFATDIAQELYDTGTSWIPVGTPVPIGTIMQFAGAGDPIDADGVTRWMVANGRNTLLRSTYASLFNLIGVNYGAGADGTKFALPNLQGRVPVGAGTGPGLTARSLYAASGEESHALAAAENAAHAHGVTDPGHAHGVNDPGHAHGLTPDSNIYNSQSGALISLNSPASGTLFQMFRNDISAAGAGTGVSIQGAGTGVSIQNQGSGTAHNNMQPYLVVNHIIKVL